MANREVEVQALTQTRVKESGAHCTCYWNTGDHSDSCDLAQEWDRQHGLAEDEIYEDDWS